MIASLPTLLLFLFSGLVLVAEDLVEVGEVVWSFESGAAIRSSPSLGRDGTLYIGSEDKKVYAIDGKTGVEVTVAGPVSRNPEQLKRVAAQKLEYVLKKG